MNSNKPHIVAIIATKNRPELLENRSLKSVFNQSRLPNQVIVVDDSDRQDTQRTNQSITTKFKKKFCKSATTYILNHRTKGAAGSWNSAVDILLQQGHSPESIFIAILDDDDEWHSEYLYFCTKYIEENLLDMTSCYFYRITNNRRIIQPSPEELRETDFLIGNPGIQGSNIFVRLSRFLEAGCFDENMQSCTDRDICIRIIGLGITKYRSIPIPLMNHFAENNRPRMSLANSVSKDKGLHSFWTKYSKRMNMREQKLFLHRAKTLFGWELPTPSKSEQVTHKTEKHNILTESFNLYIGIICSSYHIIFPLIQQLAKLQNESFIQDLKLFLLENNLSYNDKTRIIKIADSLNITFLTKFMQDNWIGTVDYFKNFSRNRNNLFSIAQARTMLQKYIAQAINPHSEETIAWILDEDMRLTPENIKGIKKLPLLKKQGIDVVIGTYEYASPNPPINGIRVQLVDIWHNLMWMTKQDLQKIIDDFSSENNLLIEKYPDYYYDLSRKHTGHLEHPFWIEPKNPQETFSEAISRISKDAKLIFSGIPLTRPLKTSSNSYMEKRIKDSVNRGGTTFILNPTALNSVPNMDIKIGRTDIRRSDMIWAIICKHYRKLSIKKVDIPIFHSGKGNPDNFQFDLEKIKDEIAGSCLYASLTEFLTLNSSHNLHFNDSEITDIILRFKKHIKQRMIALQLSFYRARGISKCIQNLEIHKTNSNIQILTRYINNNFSSRNFRLLERYINKVDSSILIQVLKSMQKKSDIYQKCVIK